MPSASWARGAATASAAAAGASPAASTSYGRLLRAAAASGRRCHSRRSSTAVAVAATTMDLSKRHNERVRRPENVEGSFFVDRTCIDCDTCRWMAPDTFGRVGEQSAVRAQPADREGRVQALRALLSCPTYSIHVTDRSPAELREAQDGLPAPVPGLVEAAAATAPQAPSQAQLQTANGGADSGGGGEAVAQTPPPVPYGVYYTGWASEASFAGCSYLIVRPQGNILVDSPRFNPVLARRVEAMGGVKYMFLTHRDDVGDHEAWAKRFGATRILHETEVNTRQGTDKVEVKLSGEGPWRLAEDGSVVTAPAAAGRPMGGAEDGGGEGGADVTLIFTPGHTRGHVCMYYAPQKALFSGDHLCSAAGSVDGAAQDRLHIFSDFNWYSVPLQLASVIKLLQYDWLHVLPAHGRRAHLRDAAARLAAVSELLSSNGADGAAAAAAATNGATAAAAAP